MRIKLINGDELSGVSSVDIREGWVFAKIPARSEQEKTTSRVIPRENIEQIMVSNEEKWDQITVEGK